MRNIVIILALALSIILIAIGGFLTYKKLTTQEKVHYHAGFIVFQNDKKIDFSDFKYMYVKPCDDVKGNLTPEDIQAEKAHLHDSVGDVVHVEQKGALWRDIFTNIHYKIDYSKAKAYLNGREALNFQNLPIKSDDSLVVLTGDNATNHLSDSLSKKYIESKAKDSVECGE